MGLLSKKVKLPVTGNVPLLALAGVAGAGILL
jgi:hypothetical protein